MNRWGTLAVAGSGEANAALLELFESRARATIRYADPSAWITATAVARAIADFRDRLKADQHEVGMIAVSDQGPAAAMSEVQQAASSGFCSPLRYAAANPGSLVAVTCIAFGFRGPTLNLTMCPTDGVSVALHLCAGWLRRRSARWMVLATFRGHSIETGCSRAILLADPESFKQPANDLNCAVAEWLAYTGEVNRIHEVSLTQTH